MLKAIHPLLGADLLFILASMGHGDEIAIVDSNFPAAGLAHRLVNMRGVDVSDLVSAVLTVLPLDDTVPCPAVLMRVPDSVDVAATAVGSIRTALDSAMGSRVKVSELGRFEFYERARKAFAIVSTGEQRPYGNVLLVAGTVSGGPMSYD